MAANYRDGRIDGSAYSRSAGSQQSQLPDGSCNFRDLTSGARAPVCGCKRFWLDNGPGERAYCACGHHACYHTWLSQQTRPSAQASRSIIANEPAQQARARDTPEGYYAVHHAGAGASPKPPTGLGIRPGSRQQSSHSQSINTRVWEALNGFARDQDDGSNSETTSKLPSTAVASVNGDAMPYQRPMGPPINIPATSTARLGFEEYMGSATEVATPSIAGTPDLHAFAPPGTQPRFSPARPPLPSEPVRATTEPILQVASQESSQNIPLTQRDVQALLQTYGRRLDVLESLSFSHVPVEEVQEHLESYNVRMFELEQWRAERDQEREAAESADEKEKTASSKRHQLLPDEAASSDGSFDSAAAIHTEAAVLATIAANMENDPRFEALESRVTDLENLAMPSFAQPWHVQVILLPWGRQLPGIWFSSSEATQQSQRSAMHESDEWTGAQSAGKLSFNSSCSAAWTTESIQAWAEDAQDWLSPKACGPTGTVFQRLASRGLVRDLTMTASDSRHIMGAIANAFRKVLPWEKQASNHLTEKYQSLREPFVPLRKVRKSARLRFLPQSEMVTSATWTASYLDSSVLMKVNGGERRLYITTPDAYLQHIHDGWTWQSLQELPARDSDGMIHHAQVDAKVAKEACWSYNDKLDYAPSLNSSFGSHATHASQWSTRSQPSAQQNHAEQVQAMSPISEARPLRQRTVSLPSSTSMPDQQIASLPKRRVASFEPSMTNPLTAQSNDQTALAIKRRRLSASPEAERRGVNFTPRWSREPPSPFRSESNAAESRSQGATSSSRMIRGTTPFAYATPHSNSNFIGLSQLIAGCGDGDTELGTDIIGNTSQHGDEDVEEEWSGVKEGAADDEDEDEDIEMGSTGDSALDDAEIDEDDLEEGLTIYES